MDDSTMRLIGVILLMIGILLCMSLFSQLKEKPRKSNPEPNIDPVFINTGEDNK